MEHLMNKQNKILRNVAFIVYIKKCVFPTKRKTYRWPLSTNQQSAPSTAHPLNQSTGATKTKIFKCRISTPVFGQVKYFFAVIVVIIVQFFYTVCFRSNSSAYRTVIRFTCRPVNPHDYKCLHSVAQCLNLAPNLASLISNNLDAQKQAEEKRKCEPKWRKSV